MFKARHIAAIMISSVLAHGSHAYVSLSLSTTNDYDFAMPPSATNAITGIGAGYDDPYSIVRFEDRAFLLRALHERQRWTSLSRPHWNEFLNSRDVSFVLSSIEGSPLEYDASVYIPWSISQTNEQAISYLASDPLFQEGAFRCDDTTSWRVDGHDYSTYAPIQTASQDSFISPSRISTNTVIDLKTPVSMSAISNGYHNIALLNHIGAGPLQESITCPNSNKWTKSESQNFIGYGQWATNTVTDQSTGRTAKYPYLTYMDVVGSTNIQTAGHTYAGTVADTADFVHYKSRERVTYCGVRVNNYDKTASSVIVDNTILTISEDATAGDPSGFSSNWHVSCSFCYKTSNDQFDMSGYGPAAYFIGLFEVTDITERSLRSVGLSSTSVTTNSHDRYVYVFKDYGTISTAYSPYSFRWFDFTLNRSSFYLYFLVESGISSGVDDPPEYTYPTDLIPTTVDGHYGMLEFAAIAKRTKRIKLHDVRVIWYVTPIFKARVLDSDFPLN